MSEETKTSGSLDKYLNDIATFSVLKSQEELEAFKEIELLESDVALKLLQPNPRLASEQLEAILTDPDISSDRSDAIRAILKGRKTPEAVALFLEAVRLTEVGRTWMAEAIKQSDSAQGLGSNKSRWIKSLQKSLKASSDAKNRFMAANLRLVIAIAKKYIRPGMHQTLGDLIQEGNIGLMKAVERFDLHRGFKFSTYSMWWIRHHIRRSITEREPTIRIPVHMSDHVYRINKVESKHIAQTGVRPNEETLCRDAKLPLHKVQTALSNRAFRVVSLESPCGDDGDSQLIDVIEDENSVSPYDFTLSGVMAVEIKAALSALTPVESKIIRWRFGLDGDDGKKLQEIADILDLSRERIRQIEERALSKLRVHGIGGEKPTSRVSRRVS